MAPAAAVSSAPRAEHVAAAAAAVPRSGTPSPGRYGRHGARGISGRVRGAKTGERGIAADVSNARTGPASHVRDAAGS